VFWCNNDKSPEDVSGARSQNAVYIKYTSDSGQCPTLCFHNESVIATHTPLESHLKVLSIPNHSFSVSALLYKLLT